MYSEYNMFKILFKCNKPPLNNSNLMQKFTVIGHPDIKKEELRACNLMGVLSDGTLVYEKGAHLKPAAENMDLAEVYLNINKPDHRSIITENSAVFKNGPTTGVKLKAEQPDVVTQKIKDLNEHIQRVDSNVALLEKEVNERDNKRIYTEAMNVTQKEVDTAKQQKLLSDKVENYKRELHKEFKVVAEQCKAIFESRLSNATDSISQKSSELIDSAVSRELFGLEDKVLISTNMKFATETNNLKNEFLRFAEELKKELRSVIEEKANQITSDHISLDARLKAIERKVSE